MDNNKILSRVYYKVLQTFYTYILWDPDEIRNHQTVHPTRHNNPINHSRTMWLKKKKEQYQK
jgi:hypothetical protein